MEPKKKNYAKSPISGPSSSIQNSDNCGTEPEMHLKVPNSTENDIIIAKILQEEFDFEYEITKRAMATKQNSPEFSFQNLFPKIGSFLNLSENSRHRVKTSNIPNCFSFYSIADKANRLSKERNVNLSVNIENGISVEDNVTIGESITNEISTDECETREKSDIKIIKNEISIDESVTHEDFIAMLNSNPILHEFNQNIRCFIQEFVSLEVDMLDQIQVINEFLNFIDYEIEKLPISKDSLPVVKEMSEKVIMDKIYYKIFELECDRERSNKLSESMKRHSWIQLQHLDLPLQFATHEQLLARAIDELIKIDLSKSPKEKLKSLAVASKTAFQIITSDPARRDHGAATDDFLPLLIFLILKAQPSRLYSNAQFIARFKRNESPSRIDIFLLVFWLQFHSSKKYHPNQFLFPLKITIN